MIVEGSLKIIDFIKSQSQKNKACNFANCVLKLLKEEEVFYLFQRLCG